MAKRTSRLADFQNQLNFYYENKRNISENKFADLVRMNQPWLTKQKSKKSGSVKIELLVNLCLGFGLSLDESIYFMALAERCFNPLNYSHKVYKEIIDEYYRTDYINRWLSSGKDPCLALDYADELAEKKGAEPLYDNRR